LDQEELDWIRIILLRKERVSIIRKRVLIFFLRILLIGCSQFWGNLLTSKGLEEEKRLGEKEGPG